MKKVLCVLLILIFLANMGQAQLIINSEKQSNENGFRAKIGIGDSEEAQIFLNGNFRARWRFLVVYGTATNGEKEVRFQGYFRGSYFYLQIPLRGTIVNIIGRCSFNENNEFRGNWRVRGTRTTGWIQGAFTR